MISVVICSINSAKFNAARTMFRAVMGQEPWELIGMHHPSSMAQGYNQALTRLRGDIVVYCHDDIVVLNPDFPGRLKQHLQRFDIVGVAGTRRMVDAKWYTAGTPHVFGQLVQLRDDGSLVLHIHNAPQPAIDDIQAIDGVFMAMRRPVLDQVAFDQDVFDGFHLYDLDFCLTSLTRGMRLGVACDINLLHRSHGSYDADWEKYAACFRRKWAGHIAPITERADCWGRVIEVESALHAAILMDPPYWRTGVQNRKS